MERTSCIKFSPHELVHQDVRLVLNSSLHCWRGHVTVLGSKMEDALELVDLNFYFFPFVKACLFAYPVYHLGG